MSLAKFPDKTLTIAGTVSFTLAVFFLVLSAVAIPCAFLVIALAGSFVFLKDKWIESGADEWLLIIRDGQLLKAGIGMKTFIGLSDTVVKFPSKVEKVTFSANNVTQEMQGVSITGFAFWSVFR